MKHIVLTIIALFITAATYAANPVTTATPSSDDYSEVEALFSVTGDDIVETARKFIGTPYRYGGKGPKGFDCSGFTGYVYKRLNISLKSNSRAQYTEGMQVGKDELKAGDLVFFAGRNSRGGVGHVGIVTKVNEDGDFDFIHASCSQGVTVSNSSERYYSCRYKGARRIVEDYSDMLASIR